MRRCGYVRCLVLFWGLLLVHAAGALAQPGKPNILVIMSDDFGITNISAYGEGLVGYRTPNIDRIANEGMRFTDYYIVQEFLSTFEEFPPSQKPAKFNVEDVLAKMRGAANN